MQLLDICQLIIDCEHKTAPTQETGFPSIRTPNIGRGHFILEGVNRVSEETYRLWTRRAVPQPGDLIMAREAPVGNVAMITEELRPCLGQRTLLLRPDRTKVEPAFLNYFLNGPYVQGLICAKTNGATVAHLNMKDVRTMDLPELPPLPLQRRIAGILLTYDVLMENNWRRIRLLEAMARTLYREWFVRPCQGGKLPKGYEAKMLGDLAEEVRRTVEPSEIESETPYFGLEHLPRRSIALTEWGTANQVQSTKHAFKKGEILFGKIRPYFHKVGVAPLDGVCSSDAIVIRPRSSDYFAVVLSCASSDHFVAHATQTSQGTKMPRANWDVLTKYQVSLPPKSQLLQFSQCVEAIVAQLHNLIFKNRSLRRTRDLLLPRLVSGQLKLEEN